MIDPIQATNQHTEQEKCSVCEQFKPLYILKGHGNQHFERVEDYCTQWQFHVVLAGRRYATVCPDCSALFEEYAHVQNR